MDELGFNKIAAAVLVTALGYMFLKEASHAVLHVEQPSTPAYALEIPDTDGPDVVEELPFPQPEYVAAMDATRGAKVFKKCTSCHTSEKGGNNGTGPNLYGIVGSNAAQTGDFKYSSALKSANLNWTYEDLDGFLTRPSKYVKGTNMSFVGLKKEADRAAVIEYLRVAADTPMPRPVAVVATETETDMGELTVITPELEIPVVQDAPIVEVPNVETPGDEVPATDHAQDPTDEGGH